MNARSLRNISRTGTTATRRNIASSQDTSSSTKVDGSWMSQNEAERKELIKQRFQLCLHGWNDPADQGQALSMTLLASPGGIFALSIVSFG
jgi:hypothetical protein